MRAVNAAILMALVGLPYAGLAQNYSHDANERMAQVGASSEWRQIPASIRECAAAKYHSTVNKMIELARLPERGVLDVCKRELAADAAAEKAAGERRQVERVANFKAAEEVRRKANAEEVERKAEQGRRAAAEWEAGAAQRQVTAKETAKKEAEAAGPPMQCTVVRYQGAVAGNRGELGYLNSSMNPADLAARNPLRCAPNALAQLWTCSGFAAQSDNEGIVISWSKNTISVVSPMDLIIGRRDVLVSVRRDDAWCLNETPASTDPSDNVESFRLGKITYQN